MPPSSRPTPNANFIKMLLDKLEEVVHSKPDDKSPVSPRNLWYYEVTVPGQVEILISLLKDVYSGPRERIQIVDGLNGVVAGLQGENATLVEIRIAGSIIRLREGALS